MGETYTVVVGEKGQITVPAELRKKYGITKGEVIIIEDAENKVSLIPAVVLPKYRFDWDEEDKLAEKDLESGKVKRYSSTDYLKELEYRIMEKDKFIAKETSGGEIITSSNKASTKPKAKREKINESDS